MWNSKLFEQFKNDRENCILQDFSYAGYHYGEEEIPSPPVTLNIADFGVLPDTGEDVTDKIQEVINRLEEMGGGVLFIPAGTYELNCDKERQNYLKISRSNVIIRGEGDATVIRKNNRLMSDAQPWFSPGIIHAGENLWDNNSYISTDDLPYISEVAVSAKAGQDTIKLNSAKGLEAGDCVLLCMRNTDDAGTLSKKVIAPLEIEDAWENKKNAGVNRMIDYAWLAEVKSVNADGRITFMQPLRADIDVEFAPFVCKFPMLSEVGVENIRFESAWDDDGYYHHKTLEHDYGWNAVIFNQVKHGFVRNLTINNYTQGVQIRNGRNVTVSNITMNGFPGHYGVKSYTYACDNMFEDIKINCHRTHVAGVEGYTQGNVYRNFRITSDASDMDLHGAGAPAYNLFEKIDGTEKICGGAGPQNLPHSGHYNTFWNIGIKHSDEIRAPELTYDADDDLFFAWFWMKNNPKPNPCCRMYPKSIVSGVYSTDERVITVEGQSADRADEWIYIEGLNREGIEPASLYRAQLEMRKKG